MSITLFYIEKTPFTPIKQKVLKVEKTEIFPRGLTNSFGPKLPFFQLSFFRQYRPGRSLFYDILDQKNAFLGYKNKKFKKVGKLKFVQRR